MSNTESILTNQCALQKDRPLIVGVSGGADSLCLMGILHEAGYSIIVAHFDHQLRGESHQDAQMVKETCAHLSIECVVGTENVRAYAEDKKLSIEEAARNLRYRFLFKLARERHAQAVAVGHTADDQVETVLMHILRGSSLNGLKGMSYRAVIQTFDAQIPIVRPLLEMSRAETVEYCKAHDLRPHYDISNDSLEYQRNKIRHQLIPTLETYNPKIREALLRMSQTLKDDSDLLDSLVDSLWTECAIPQSGFVTLDFSLLTKNAPALQRRLVLRAMQTLVPDIDVDFATLNRAVENMGKRVDLKSSLYMFREGNQIYICTKDAELPLNLFPQWGEDILVSIPSTIELANGWKFTIARVENVRAEEISANENQLEVWFDADTLTESLHLRKCHPGDRIIPLGMDGHSQKLSDLFVNEKIPQRARENWALLCSGENIIWVLGLRSAHSCRVKEKTKRIIHCVVTK
ncbi:MAG: tRNA lysidine(34) synthetase TilS [Chloroflexi bacterium]|nr:tRNA lysidine(34) synthetase TilS [Chloroflexota bacterium]